MNTKYNITDIMEYIKCTFVISFLNYHFNTFHIILMINFQDDWNKQNSYKPYTKHLTMLHCKFADPAYYATHRTSSNKKAE